jgi:ATP-binding cassette subfamily B protein
MARPYGRLGIEPASATGNSLLRRGSSDEVEESGARAVPEVASERESEAVAPADPHAAATTREGFAVLGVAIRREPWIFTLSTVGSLLFGALTVADAWVLGWSTDHVVLPAFKNGEIGSGLLLAVLALFLGVALLRAVGIVARRLGAGVMQYRMQAHYRRAVTRQYLSLPMEWHQRHPTGELLSNANSDVEAAWGPIAPLPMAVGTVAMMVIAVAQMFVADVVLALVGLLVFPAVVLANLAYQRIASPLMTRAQQLRAEVSEIAHESFDGAMVVKTLGREGEETERFAAKARELRDVNIRAGRIRAAFDPTLAALPNLGVLVVLAVGVNRVLHGSTDAGDVVTVSYLLTIVSFPIRSIGWLLGEFPRSVVGFRRVSSVLEATGEMPYGELAVPNSAVTGARLDVEHLAYSYEPGQALLEDVTFSVEPGRSLAIVGATASGKSTLTALLTRLVDPDAGRILIDGVDLRDLAHGELAEVAAVVPQNAFLFDDDVRGNVALGADVSDEEVWAALRAAQADGFVAALPHGLDTRLGERGTSLSGGQRQRISLARALVRRPRLLVLDDATSAVDPEVEGRILAALRTSTGASTGPGATLVVVAYRKATIALADEVVHLEGGRVVDRGTHAELLARSPGYARLVNAYEHGTHGEHGEHGSVDALASEVGS